MKRPKQLPAVDRNKATKCAVPAGAKVKPSDWTSYIGPALGALGSIF
jgi:hypothetical protein